MSLPTQNTGDLITATIWNNMITAVNTLYGGTTGQVLIGQTGSLAIFATVNRVKAFNSTTQAVSGSGATTVLTFDSNDEDTNSLHSTSVNTSRLTLTAGTWLLMGRVYLTSSANNFSVIIREDGTTNLMAGGDYGNINTGVHSVTGYVTIAATHYFELIVVDEGGAGAAQTAGHASRRELQTSFEAICVVKTA